MTYPIVKELAEKTGKNTKEVNELYNAAKAEAYETFNNKSGDFMSYANQILRDKLETANMSELNTELGGSFVEIAKEQEGFIQGLGKSLNEGIKNSGALDTLTNLGATAIFGPLGKPLNDLTNVSDKTHKKIGNWFDELSPKAQQNYLEDHPNSDAAEGFDFNSEKDDDTLHNDLDDKPESDLKNTKPLKTKTNTNTADKNYNKTAKVKRYVKRNDKGKVRKAKKPTVEKKAIASLELAEPVIDSDALVDALKAFYLMMYYSTEGSDKLPKDLIKQSQIQWEPALDVFLTTFRIPKLAISKLLQAAYDNLPFSDKINALVVKSGEALKTKKEDFERDIKISKIELGLLKAFSAYFIRNSESALTFLQKNISFLKEPKLNLIFAQTFTNHDSLNVTSQNSTKILIENLVKEVTGKKSLNLTVEEKVKLKALNPQLLTQYNQLKRTLNTIYKDWIQNYVRQSGKHKVDYQTLYKDLTDAQIDNNLSPNFVGFVDDSLNYYTIADKLIDGKPVGQITMNSGYDADEDNSYVFKAKTPMGESPYYTVSFKSDRVSKKFETVNKLEDIIITVRNKWLKALRMESKTQLLAAQLELMYKYAARSGRSGNEANGEPTFGITTLRCGQVTKQGNGYLIKYKGKKGADQIHLLNATTTNDRFLIKVIEKQLEGKLKSDPLWTYKGKEISATSTLHYLKSISGISNVKLHYVRHMMGNKLAREIIKNSPLRKGVSQAKAESWYKEAMKKVGETLAHSTNGKVTGLTSIKSYIAPNLQREFFINLGLRVPSFIPKD